MASATADHRDHLHIESIPAVDLRLLSQPELFSLSLCSSAPFPSNAETELFIPKIDRTVFNESAGSRKQTFYRLRLAAPRNYLHHPHHSSPSSKPLSPRHLRLNPEPLDEESSNALHLLKSLFNIDDSLTANTKEEELDEVKDLVPVQIEYPSGSPDLQNIPVGIVSCSRITRKRGRPRKDEKDNWLFKSGNFVAEEHGETSTTDRVSEIANAGDFNGLSENERRIELPKKEEKYNWPSESGNFLAEEHGGTSTIGRVSEMENAGRFNSSSENKRRRGRPRKNEKDNCLAESGNLVVEKHGETFTVGRVVEMANEGDVNSFSESKKRRGRPPKDESQIRVVSHEKHKVGNKIEKADVGNVDVPSDILEELRRRTEGMKTEVELFEFMGGLEGEWLTKNHKKRIIDANNFGNVLPVGWKIMLFVKRRGCHFSLACSRYIRFSHFPFSFVVIGYLLILYQFCLVLLLFGNNVYFCKFLCDV